MNRRLLKNAFPLVEKLDLHFYESSIFIKNFTESWHHYNEERILFVAMNEFGVHTQAGQTGVMLGEHEQSSALFHEVEDSAQKREAGALSARATVELSALSYVALVHQHIFKENNTLFPIADRVGFNGQAGKSDRGLRIYRTRSVQGGHN